MLRLASVGVLLLSLVGCAASPVPAPAPRAPAPVARVDVPAPAVAREEPEEPVAELEPVVEDSEPRVPAFAEPLVPHEQTRVVVLEYHALGDIEDTMWVAPASFDEQLEWLSANHVSVVRMSDLTAWLDGRIELPKVAAVITIDDAHKSARKVALPKLARRGMPFTLALNTAAIEERRVGAMSWDDVRDVMQSGLCEIASHSHVHGFMARMTDASNRRELELSRSLIEEHTGVRPTAFVFPFGSLDARTVRLTEEAGYDLAFAAWGPTVAAKSPRFRLGRFAVTREMDMSTFAHPFRDAARQALPAVVGAKRAVASRD